MRWLPFGCLAAAVALSVYQISRAVDCDAHTTRLLQVWFYAAPFLLLSALLLMPAAVLDQKARGGRRDVWVGLLLTAWFAAAGVWAYSYYRQLGCMS